jgi:hypothetical protein
MLVNIEAAARRVAEAKQRQAEADTAVDAAKGAAATVKSRVDALQAERVALVETARSTGDADGAAGLRLACLDADLADLAALVRDAQAGIQRAATDAAQAFQATAAAERDFDLDKGREREAMLIERAEELAGMLATALTELKAIQRQRGGRPSWAPSKELVGALTSLRLVAGGRALAAA